MEKKITINILHCGDCIVNERLPFGRGRANRSIIIPNFAFLIKHPDALILVNCGWSNYFTMICERTSHPVSHFIDLACLEDEQRVRVQLKKIGLTPRDLDIIILTDLDSEHVSALKTVYAAGRILVNRKELESAAACAEEYPEELWNNVRIKSRFGSKIIESDDDTYAKALEYKKKYRHSVWNGTTVLKWGHKRYLISGENELEETLINVGRYRPTLWEGTRIEPVDLIKNGIGPFGESRDLLGDKSVVLTSTPGFTSGGISVTVWSGIYSALIVGNCGFGPESWRKVTLPGHFTDGNKLHQSIKWLHGMDSDHYNRGILATHDSQLVGINSISLG